MAEKNEYNTKNKEEIENYLKSASGTHFTVAEICDHFKSQGKNIGVATVYRRLERLVEEGKVTKYIIDGTSSACFEYLDGHEHCESNCFHCKCEKCGKIFHLKGEELAPLKSVLESHKFNLNSRRTVFYGVCDSCRKV